MRQPLGFTFGEAFHGLIACHRLYESAATEEFAQNIKKLWEKNTNEDLIAIRGWFRMPGDQAKGRPAPGEGTAAAWW